MTFTNLQDANKQIHQLAQSLESARCRTAELQGQIAEARGRAIALRIENENTLEEIALIRGDLARIQKSPVAEELLAVCQKISIEKMRQDALRAEKVNVEKNLGHICDYARSLGIDV